MTAMMVISGCGQKAADQASVQSQKTGGTGAGQVENSTSSSASGQYVASDSVSDESEDEVDYSRALAKSNQEFDDEDAELTINENRDVSLSLPVAQKDYTVMVYMIGSNLESKLGNASKDLLEMEEAQVNFASTNLIVYTGGSRRWTSDVPSDRNSVLDLSQTGVDRIVAQTSTSADMGAPSTLREYVNFCTENFPADHYALIFWDHGGGPLWGYGSDELFDSDSLTLAEMKEAMEETVFASENTKLDFVGFDACLMGSVENMNLWSQYANYYVGSEELEPGDGWDYHFLSVLNQTNEPEAVTGEIVEKYGTYYEAQKSDTYNPDVTLSVADLSRIGEIRDAMDAVSSRLTTRLDQGGYNEIQKSMGEVKSCGIVENTKGGSSFSYDLVDMGSLANEMVSQAEEESQRLQEVVDSFIVKQCSNVEGTTGVTMYYPHANKGQYAKLQDLFAQISISGEYTAYLGNVTQRWMSSSTRDWALGELTGGKDSSNSNLLTYILSEEQQENVSSAYYTILNDRRDGTYTPVLSNVQVKPSRDGKIEIPANPEALCLVSDTGDRTIWPFHQIESGKTRAVYKTDAARLQNHLYTEYDWFAQVCYQDVSIVLSQMKDSGEVQIQTINSEDGESVETAGKNTISTSGWEGISYSYHSVIPARYESGVIAPSAKWGGDNDYWMVTSSLDQKFSFEFVPLSDLRSGNFCIQLVIEDVSGEQYASELYAIASDGNGQEYIEKTAKGAVVYAVYDDHAEVTGYTGNDTKLTISKSVEGVPVTVIRGGALSRVILGDSNGYFPFKKITLPDSIETIGNGAFRYCHDLEKINMPSSLKSIGDAAFATCTSLKKIELPDGVEKIGKGAFAYCTALKNITIPSSLDMLGEAVFLGCTELTEIKMSGKAKDGITTGGYSVRSNMLLSADEMTVLAYACGRADDVVIPEGITNIGYGAFCRAEMKQVQFPDSLQEIDNFAFYKTLNLSVPELPDSLERIGTYAFGANYIESDEELTQGVIEDIQIGKNVTSIGKGAFDEFLMRRFIVDDQNSSYSAVDGSLCNKAGDYLECLAGSNQKIFTVPGGVINLDMEVFDYVDIYNRGIDTIEVIIPESVTKLINTASTNVFWLEALIHCAPGSVAEEYAREKEIDFDFELETDFEEYTEDTAHGTCTFRVYNDHAALLDYSGTDRTLEVPSEVQGKPVTVIGNGRDNVQKYDSYSEKTEFAEGESKSIEEVILPEGVTQISGKAFDNCYLDSIVLPASIEVIGDNAVNLLMGGEMPEIPDSLRYIGSKFIKCSPAGDVTIPSGLVYAHPEAFSGLSSVTSFVMNTENEHFSVRDGILYDAEGSTLLSYPNGVFTEENSEAVIPEGTTAIGQNAFYECSRLKSVTLPDGVLKIEKNAFNSCYALENIQFPEGVREIEDSAFRSCTSLTKVVLPEGLEKIDSHGFANCKELTEVVFPETLTTLGLRAFGDCTKLKIAELPKNLAVIDNEVFFTSDETEPIEDGKEVVLSLGSSVRSIGRDAFTMLGVTSYEVDEENPYFGAVEGFLTNHAGNTLISCPTGRTGTVQVPDSITRIGKYAFRHVSGMTDVIIPNSVTHISDAAFEENVTIHCQEGSYARQFAVTEGISYVIE